jgi:transcriptional regulator with XRE-family HTH domain
MKNNFSKWLQTELDTRKWTQSDLSRIAELRRSSVSLYLSGGRTPELTPMLKIAAALEIHPIVIMEQVGLLQIPQEDAWMIQMQALLAQATPPMRPVLERVIRAIIKEQ